MFAAWRRETQDPRGNLGLSPRSMSVFSVGRVLDDHEGGDDGPKDCNENLLQLLLPGSDAVLMQIVVSVLRVISCLSESADNSRKLLHSSLSPKKQIICPEPPRQDVAHVPPFRRAVWCRSPVPWERVLEGCVSAPLSGLGSLSVGFG